MWTSILHLRPPPSTRASARRRSRGQPRLPSHFYLFQDRPPRPHSSSSAGADGLWKKMRQGCWEMNLVGDSTGRVSMSPRQPPKSARPPVAKFAAPPLRAWPTDLRTMEFYLLNVMEENRALKFESGICCSTPQTKSRTPTSQASKYQQVSLPRSARR